MRARNIKPGFFKNEVLGTATPYAQLLFSGLWMLADRDGRLEDRPLRIKAEIFAYRGGLDVDEFLTELASLGFITRYEVGGIKYIQIENFKKHQTPHKTEKLSTIPTKSMNNISYSTTSVKEDIITEALPPDSLIPDSLNSVSKETGDPLESPPVDFKKVFFQEGLKLLGADTKSNRSLIASWLRDYGNEKVCNAFMQTQKESAIDPKTYIIGILKDVGQKKGMVAFEAAKPISDEQRADGIRVSKKYGKYNPNDERWLEQYEARA